MDLRLDPLTDADVLAFLDAHVAQLRATSAPESTHVLDHAGLRSDDVRLWVLRDDDGAVAGCAALKRLDDAHLELKSMRTAPARRRQGLATTLLTHLLGIARDDGATRVSLETGAQPFFAPARALYAAHGFTECGPFGDYRPDPASVFMSRALG